MLLTFLIVFSGCLYAVHRDEFVGLDLSRFLRFKDGEVYVPEQGEEEPDSLAQRFRGLSDFLRDGGQVAQGEITRFQGIGTLAKPGSHEQLVKNIVLQMIVLRNMILQVIRDQEHGIDATPETEVAPETDGGVIFEEVDFEEVNATA